VAYFPGSALNTSQRFPPDRTRGGLLWGDSNTPLDGREGHGRSIAKAVSWRITGSIDTFIISFFVTGKMNLAGTIAAVEVVTKIAIYYLHERVWAAIPWGHHST
jgi:uncharacterized membrane protein